MSGTDLIDQYFMRGYGWREFVLPIKASSLKRDLPRYRQMERVHVVGKGDFTRGELEALT